MSLWAKHSQQPDLEYHSLLWPCWTVQLDWNRLKATMNKDSENQFNWSYYSWNSDVHCFGYKKDIVAFGYKKSSPDGNEVSFLWCPARTLGLVIAIQLCMMCAFCLPRAKVVYPIRLFYKIAHTDLRKLFPSPPSAVVVTLLSNVLMFQRKCHLWSSAPEERQACFCQLQTKSRQVLSVVQVRNCCASLSSVKDARIALARWADGNCSSFSGPGFVAFGSSPL